MGLRKPGKEFSTVEKLQIINDFSSNRNKWVQKLGKDLKNDLSKTELNTLNGKHVQRKQRAGRVETHGSLYINGKKVGDIEGVRFEMNNKTPTLGPFGIASQPVALSDEYTKKFLDEFVKMFENIDRELGLTPVKDEKKKKDDSEKKP